MRGQGCDTTLRPTRFLPQGYPPRMPSLSAVRKALVVLWFCCIGLLLAQSPPALAEPPLQTLTGRLEPGQGALFELPGLRRGQQLQLRAEGVHGSLDPLLAVLKPGLDIAEARIAWRERYQQLRSRHEANPATYAALLGEFAIAQADDSADGYAAVLDFTAPADGDYQLLLAASLLRPGFGDYRLTVRSSGDDVPQVRPLAGVWSNDVRVQAEDIAFTGDEPFRFVELRPVQAGETLQVLVEAAAGTPAPQLQLLDYGDKPLAVAEPVDGAPPQRLLRHAFVRGDNAPRLRIVRPDGVREARYRLLAGIDAPPLTAGNAGPVGRPVLQTPIPVQVGVRMDQITGVDQRGENFGVVASLRMDWTDPTLAFSPESCGCRYRTFSGEGFAQFVQQQGALWPEFVLFNQQGNRWAQKRTVVLRPDGSVQYFERFSTTLQAPDFDFKRFPFDTQRFFIRVELVAPEWKFRFTELPGYSGLGRQLGEEEWVTTGFDTVISSETETTGLPVSRYSYGFTAERHLNYYVYRIFLPVLVIIVIAWVTLFLKDYGKRIEAAAGNLLLFIAFNFTISSDLPRLGYLSFLDTLLLSAFVVTGFMFVLAVWMRRLEAGGATDELRRIDGWVIGLYPLAYALGVGAIVAVYR